MSENLDHARRLARQLERLVANGGDIEAELAGSSYALSGEAIISANDAGDLAVDMRRVLLMVAGGGPTAYLAFDWQSHGFYLTNETGEDTERYLGDDYGAIADYLAEKLGGWDTDAEVVR